MLIKSTVVYKSVTLLEIDNLPDFVVISGLNGSGKTHLLEGISSSIILLKERGLPLSPIKLVDHNTLSPTNGTIVSVQNLNDQVQQAWNNYKNYLDSKKANPNITFNSFLGDTRFQKLLSTIASYAKKNVEKLSIDDFYKHYPMKDGLNNVDIFQQNFSFLFKRYQVKKLNNKFQKFLAQESADRNIGFFDDGEFVKLYGEPPWDLVNKILNEANLDYQINAPELLHHEIPYELKLINNFNKAKILFSDLSSGEKVLMSLALSLYNSKFDIEFPKVLLMDEPDAHLHPSMTKSFLEVIQKVFVLEKKVKVLITTHSPSTVALAPEEALYVMNKTEPRIEKVSKDKALSILTSGVPTLSINYENRRQVFVESKNDVIFYEGIYKKLKNKLVPDISINFISSSIGGSGNCDAVKEVVKQLVNSGNRSVYGIIDWDMKNSSSEYIKVIGQGKRYSIENYIFDPILLGAFLLREKVINRSDVGLSESENYTDFDKFDNTKLQNIVNFITDKIASKMSCKLDLTPEESKYISGSKVDLPRWYLRTQGHELEKNIKGTFPQLNKFNKENKEEALKLEVINKVIDDLPNLIPEDFYLLFSEIQNYKQT